MKRRGRELLGLYFSLRSPIKLHSLTELPSPTCSFQGFTPFASSFSSTTSTPNGEEEKTSPMSQRDSLLLDKFRLRKLKGSSKTAQGGPQASTLQTWSSSSEKVAEKDLKNEDEPTKVVNDFKELGLAEEFIVVLEKIGVLVPSEIQCVGIPAVLEGKSVLMSSLSGPDRTLAYLLPLIQVTSKRTFFRLVTYEIVDFGLIFGLLICSI